MHKLVLQILLAAALGLVASSALAAPTLRAEVDTADAVVTIADMFNGAGALGTKPLFLAPAPGTAGLVPIADIRVAATRAGLADFDDGGATDVRVARLATPVDAALLTRLMSADLKARGILGDGMSIDAAFDTSLADLSAAAVADPVQLVNLRFMPQSGAFTARFTLVGRDTPLDVSGSIDLMVEAPTLTATLAADTILSPTDIVMQPIPLAQAQSGNIATPDQLIGKALQRQSHAGMVLKTTDVADPQLVARSEAVTVYLRVGPLTLTIKGTAMNAASLGEPVAVLNPASKKIIHGIARSDGAVEVTAGPLSVAGL